jgi:predicted CoA-binding protein
MSDFQCEIPDFNPPSEEITNILKTSKSIAVVGLSPKETRDSNMVARYLIKQGYNVVPVNPGQKEILGRQCYKSLKEIPHPVDLVDLFINPVRIPPIADQAIEIGARVIWMQVGIVHNQASKKARNSGLQVIMNKCIKTEHEKITRQDS